MSAPFTVIVVLAGGDGARMGGAKPLRSVAGAPLIHHAIRLARAWSPHVAVAVRTESQVAGLADTPLLRDDPAIDGPLAGVDSALRHAAGLGAMRVLTLPCDMPALPADLLAGLDAVLVPGVGVSVAASGARLHPVCALWRTDTAGLLPDYLASGRRSVHGFAEACGMATAAWPESAGFANLNTPQDLTELEARLTRKT